LSPGVASTIVYYFQARLGLGNYSLRGVLRGDPLE